jgi:hypothetical protein
MHFAEGALGRSMRLGVQESFFERDLNARSLFSCFSAE